MKKNNSISIFCGIITALSAVGFTLTLLILHLLSGLGMHAVVVHHMLFALLLVLVVMTAVVFVLRGILSDFSAKAFTDVTGVRDKKSFEKYLVQLQERSDTLNIGIMMFDLNGLKWVNDHLGHEQGDLFIQAFASCLTRILTNNSFLARFGGDEFVIVQEHTTPQELESMNDHLKELIDEYNRSSTYSISYAVGWEVSYPNHYYLMDDLMRTADQNMYLDKSRKKQGRGDPISRITANRSVPIIAEDFLAAKIQSLLAGERSYLMFMTDIENFHFINDTYGYQTGNQVLNAFYDALNAETRTVFSCRYHSDIFVTISDITEVEPDIALSIIQKRCQKISSRMTDTFPIGSCVINTGACLLDDPSIDPEEYISRANLARRTAKHDYGHICCFSEKMAQDERIRGQILHSFRDALAGNAFQLFFQPKVGCKSGRIESAEVLVRWQLPDGSLRMPDSFIPVLEGTGDIIDLDFYIFEKSFAWMAEQQEHNTPVLPLSINISPIHFAHPEHLIQTVHQLFDQYHVEPQNIIFEITERTYAQNTDAVNQVIDVLHKDHVRISMDDFGSGYSSLSSLKDIHFDEVKIDRAFIADGLTDNGRIVLHDLFHILKRLDKAIVCEGVETDDMSAFLSNAGCDELQGYLYYRPMPQVAFEELLQRSV